MERREEILRNAQEAEREHALGQTRSGNLDDLMADLYAHDHEVEQGKQLSSLLKDARRSQLSVAEREVLQGMRARRPDLESCVPTLLALHEALVKTYDGGGKLMICGNGGSNADAMHIAGELCKSFERKRPLPEAIVARLQGLPLGEELAKHLESGLAAISLGFNGSLKTAVENDCPLRDIAFAQEAFALGKPGDVLMGISTSGNAGNCLMALSAAKALGATAVSLTGPNGGKMAAMADIAIKAPGDSVKVIQEAHVVLYHTMCALIEAHYFPEKR